MNKTVLFVILSLVTGFAAGAWSMSASQPDSGQDAGPAAYFDAEAPATERLAALERIVILKTFEAGEDIPAATEA